MEWIQNLAQNTQFPIVAALALGLLTSVSPCPLATNITATAYISRQLESKRAVFISGLWYTLGRGMSYLIIALIIYWGASKFEIARFFQTKGELFLAPILIVVGLVMLNVIRLNFLGGGNFTERMSEKFKDKGQLGAFVLGILFALAFCPYSGALFFGMLIPMSIQQSSGLLLPAIFALGTGIPVILFAYLLAFSAFKIGKAFTKIQTAEKYMRKLAGGAFVLAGIYYLGIFLL
ncbi:MAG: aromatic aminobenezylarsenical efflux permease ArsG family transporter [Cyclobacteriaceae bacterium]|nr:sulfite exporter TauE/SafE family protein [Cyclobacteriaceae bacterium]MCH8514828.1 aromatic aminobenezylarsenical efflux permease ArsG family transporter [Cyclobacteriaceae bacterium]